MYVLHSDNRAVTINGSIIHDSQIHCTSVAVLYPYHVSVLPAIGDAYKSWKRFQNSALLLHRSVTQYRHKFFISLIEDQPRTQAPPHFSAWGGAWVRGY